MRQQGLLGSTSTRMQALRQDEKPSKRRRAPPEVSTGSASASVRALRIGHCQLQARLSGRVERRGSQVAVGVGMRCHDAILWHIIQGSDVRAWPSIMIQPAFLAKLTHSLSGVAYAMLPSSLAKNVYAPWPAALGCGDGQRRRRHRARSCRGRRCAPCRSSRRRRSRRWRWCAPNAAAGPCRSWPAQRRRRCTKRRQANWPVACGYCCGLTRSIFECSLFSPDK